MKRIKNFRLAMQGITALLLFDSAIAAGADQMIRAMHAPAVALPAVQQIAAPVAAQPATPTSQIKLPADSPTSVKRPAVGGLSDATKARLKNAGLDAADPSLMTKLQAKLLSSGASFRSAHMSSIKIVPKLPGVSKTQSLGGAPAGAAVSALGPKQGAGTGDRISAPLLPGEATFVALYQLNTPVEQIKAISGNKAISGDGIYQALFTSPKSPKTIDGETPFKTTVTYSGACNVNSVMNEGLNVGAVGELFGVTTPPDAVGKYYYFLGLNHVGFDLGATPKNLLISMDGPIRGSFSMPASSRTVTMTVTLTIDAAPPFVTNNNYGIGKGSGLFANSGATRLDPGTNPNASTSGDDNVGVAVNLGSGWSVTSAKITHAHSVLDAPNDSTPDNSYRGASVTQLPSSGRLQTTVHWHYGPAESLSYTIEWQLQGPGGQRPLMTMPLGGPCDS